MEWDFVFLIFLLAFKLTYFTIHQEMISVVIIRPITLPVIKA